MMTFSSVLGSRRCSSGATSAAGAPSRCCRDGHADGARPRPSPTRARAPPLTWSSPATPSGPDKRGRLDCRVKTASEVELVDLELLERHAVHRHARCLHGRTPLLHPAVARLAGLPTVDGPDLVSLIAVDEEQLAVQQLPSGRLLAHRRVCVPADSLRSRYLDERHGILLRTAATSVRRPEDTKRTSVKSGMSRPGTRG